MNLEIREAVIYPNVRAAGLFGLRVHKYQGGRDAWHGGLYRGAGWTLESAKQAALAWERHGVLPERQD